MMLVRAYAAQSAIEGLGVFAGEFIPKGTMLWALDLKFDLCFTPEEYEALAPHLLGLGPTPSVAAAATA